MLEAFVTNLGRYNEGCLDGEFLKLPAAAREHTIAAIEER
jgi:hypothetical protein